MAIIRQGSDYNANPLLRGDDMRFQVRSTEREQLIDITLQVAEAVSASGVRDGVVHVFVAHTTAGVTINENADPDVVWDLLAGLRSTYPRDAGWRHREGNADAHLKSTVVGSSVTVPVEAGRMVLGTWQSLWFCEFDGPRMRSVVVTVLGGE